MNSETRLITVDDAAELAAYFRDNRPFHAPWDPDQPDDTFTADGQRRRIEAALADHAERRGLPLVIVDGRDDAIIGRISVRDVVGPPLQRGEIGFSLAEPATGRGVATAALAEACRRAFAELDLERIEAGTIVSNLASQRLLQRGGFTLYGRPRRYIFIAGAWQDALLYERHRDD